MNEKCKREHKSEEEGKNRMKDKEEASVCSPGVAIRYLYSK
jgi:hypothetical protein